MSFNSGNLGIAYNHNKELWVQRIANLKSCYWREIAGWRAWTVVTGRKKPIIISVLLTRWGAKWGVQLQSISKLRSGSILWPFFLSKRDLYRALEELCTYSTQQLVSCQEDWASFKPSIQTWTIWRRDGCSFLAYSKHKNSEIMKKIFSFSSTSTCLIFPHRCQHSSLCCNIVIRRWDENLWNIRMQEDEKERNQHTKIASRLLLHFGGSPGFWCLTILALLENMHTCSAVKDLQYLLYFSPCNQMIYSMSWPKNCTRIV